MFNPIRYFKAKLSQWEAKEKAERDQWKIRCPRCFVPMPDKKCAACGYSAEAK